ncbi:nuclear transport factor 2 family protein [Flagellimonas sp. DF-77]|uniref:nuclear transport factor 2 family protein n=1 Tax=Flagellimonas algarum TaxID=3230298 RepID=UPI003392B6B4
MEVSKLVALWFAKWETGEYTKLPISEQFKHHSPFGIIKGRKAYMELVAANEDKFLGKTFTVHDTIYGKDKACVRYTAQQGDDFTLEVSEWYYIKNGQIDEIVAHYHIGDIRTDRAIENYA